MVWRIKYHMFTIIYMCVKKKWIKTNVLICTILLVLVELHEIHVHEYIFIFIYFLVIVRYLFIVAK